MRKNICGQSRLCLLLAAVFLFSAVSPLSADFRFTLTGDPRNSYARWAWTLSEMANKVGDEGAFHITAGDYYEYGAITTASGFYDRLKAQFGVDVVWYPTVGNHELKEGGPDMVWLRNFYYDHLEGTVNPGPPNGEETTYSWDYQNAHFVQLNNYYDGTTDDNEDGGFGDALYNWLVEDLDKNFKPVVFVIYHEPAYPDGRGGKDSPEGWERFWKLLNDRGVIAGLCAHSHQYARYQVDGDWDTVTWEVDAGNAGRLSHGDARQTFVDIAVEANGVVRFDTWQGEENQEFTLNDSWTAVALTVKLVGPADGATVDANGAVLSCETVPGAVSYQVLFGPGPEQMYYLISDTPEPPTDTITAFPFEETWWTIRVRTQTGRRSYANPIRINAEKVTPIAIENLTTGNRYIRIQPAIDDAADGDEIVVGAGIWQYLENIDFKGKNLTVRSTKPEDRAVVAATVINGSGQDSVVTFSGGEDASCVLAGFTITSGNRGIYCYESMPTITNCTIAGSGAQGMWYYWSVPTITNCTIAGNGAEGIYSYGSWKPTITNCTIAGNGAEGIYSYASWEPTVTNSTIVGNGAAGIYSERCGAALVTNCIIRDNSDSEIEGPAVVTYSSIKGGWAGEGVIDDDPCFVNPGYWVDANDPNIVVEPNDPNAVWIEGDYHLLAGSPCIDAGDNDSVPADIHDLDSDGNTTEPIPFDLDGNPRIVDGNDDGNSVVDMGAYEFFVPPIEVAMKFTPQALNPGSKGNWVKAHFVLPEGFTVEDVDTNSPAKIIEPFYVESDHMNVFINEEDLVEIEAAFDRGEFCGNGPVEGTVKVIGVLTSGQYFYGTDTIKIINNSLEYLAVLASHWLQTDCGAPDWCGGFDLDQDFVVNFVDFALFDGCCIEFITE